MPTTPNFNQIVRELLKSYTQVELQAKTGVHQGVISDLYNGKSKPQLSYAYGAALVAAYNEIKNQPQTEES